MVSEIIYMKYHNLVIHFVVFFVILNKLQHSCHYTHLHPPGRGAMEVIRVEEIFRGSVNGIL